MPIAHTLQQHSPAYQDATSSNNGNVTPAPAEWRDARYLAFALLRLAFTVAPIAFGLDKFFNVLVHWPNYLAPGSTTSHRAQGRSSCTSSGASRSSPASPSR